MGDYAEFKVLSMLIFQLSVINYLEWKTENGN